MGEEYRSPPSYPDLARKLAFIAEQAHEDRRRMLDTMRDAPTRADLIHLKDEMLAEVDAIRAETLIGLGALARQLGVPDPAHVRPARKRPPPMPPRRAPPPARESGEPVVLTDSDPPASGDRDSQHEITLNGTRAMVPLEKYLDLKAKAKSHDRWAGWGSKVSAAAAASLLVAGIIYGVTTCAPRRAAGQPAPASSVTHFAKP